jgi:hypothetical protein
MIVLVFVHGTGVRKKGYDDTLALIREQLAHWPDVRVAECRWGEAHSFQLYAWGASVPIYDATRALGDQLTPQQVEAALWGLLLRDPLGELRLLAVREGERKKLPLGGSPSDRLAAQVAVFARSGSIVGPFRDSLADVGLLDVFDEARCVVLTSDGCKDAIASAVEPFDEERFVYRFSSNSASMTSSVWPASGPPFGQAEGPFLAAPSPGDAAAA